MHCWPEACQAPCGSALGFYLQCAGFQQYQQSTYLHSARLPGCLPLWKSYLSLTVCMPELASALWSLTIGRVSCSTFPCSPTWRLYYWWIHNCRSGVEGHVSGRQEGALWTPCTVVKAHQIP